MGFVTGFLRIFSGLLTAAFAIAGIGLAIYGGVSSYLILISNSDMVIKDYGTIAPSAMTVIFGLVLLIFVILGCCGVCRESTCCMETYAAFLILLAMAHFALGGYCIVVYKNTEQRALRNQIENDLRMKLEDARLDEIQDWVLGLSEIFYGAFCLVVMHLTATVDLRLGYSYVTVPPLVLVLSGITLFSLIILGCCGISKEITCCVHLYSIILLVIAILQISVGILAVYPTMISTDEKAALRIEVDTHLGKQQKMNSTTLDNIQSLMRCCGKTFPNDTTPDVNNLLPKSCCGSGDHECQLNSTSLHQSGCTGKLMNFIVLHNDIVGLVSVSSGSIEITAGIIGFCLGYRLLRDGTTSYAM